MALHWVSNNLLTDKDQDKNLELCFYFDSFERASLHIWRDRKTLEWKRMQFSLRDILIEWKKDQGLRFGRVDEGETSFGIKQSPLIYMTKDFDEKSLQEVLAYLESQTLPAEVQRLVELLKKKKDAEN